MGPVASMLDLKGTQGLPYQLPSINVTAGLQYYHRSWLLYELQLLPSGLC